MDKTFGSGFSSLEEYKDVNAITFKENNGERVHRIENIPGKQASLKILRAVTLDSGVLSKSEAEQGLILFGDYVADEQASPNAHPNIRLLLDTIEHNLKWDISVEK
ncbi:MAG: DUF2322 family protein [Gammaproteobacteria bacterium]|jgi:hypothetical protein|nr:DUF2322 family protein [Gammaproteobacteria bacterium]